jgi:hypothetical protein
MVWVGDSTYYFPSSVDTICVFSEVGNESFVWTAELYGVLQEKRIASAQHLLVSIYFSYPPLQLPHGLIDLITEYEVNPSFPLLCFETWHVVEEYILGQDSILAQVCLQCDIIWDHSKKTQKEQQNWTRILTSFESERVASGTTRLLTIHRVT